MAYDVAKKVLKPGVFKAAEVLDISQYGKEEYGKVNKKTNN